MLYMCVIKLFNINNDNDNNIITILINKMAAQKSQKGRYC